MDGCSTRLMRRERRLRTRSGRRRSGIRNKSKPKSASGGTTDKKEEKKSGSDELLPLWCAPASKAADASANSLAFWGGPSTHLCRCRWIVDLYGWRKRRVQGGDYQAKPGIAEEDDSIGTECENERRCCRKSGRPAANAASD